MKNLLKVFTPSLVMSSGLLLLCHTATAATVGMWCQQHSPQVDSGYAIDMGEISTDPRNPVLKILSFGKANFTEQGDGTVDQMYFGADVFLQPNYSLAARSVQWRNAVPFHVPAREPRKPGASYVFYVQPEGFAANRPSSYNIRIAVTQGMRETNFILNCVDYE